MTQPIWGWMSTNRPLPHGSDLRARPGHPPVPVRHARPSSGCWPLQDMCSSSWRRPACRQSARESVLALTSYAVEVTDEVLAPAGVVPRVTRDPAQQSGHVTLNHPLMRG